MCYIYVNLINIFYNIENLVIIFLVRVQNIDFLMIHEMIFINLCVYIMNIKLIYFFTKWDHTFTVLKTSTYK